MSVLDHKEINELNYWENRKKVEGVLSNNHYKYFYTTHFGLCDSYYDNKAVLDIGCGPRGSLEWATMASRRIGLDPLANEYLRLGADQHQMEYINAFSEHIPLEDGACNIVCAFNSLDHVGNVDQTLKEIKRVTHLGGFFLLLVEVNHPPTICEPHALTPRKLIEALKPEFICDRPQVHKPDGGLYNSVRTGEKLPQPEQTNQIGYLSAMFVRILPY